MLLARQREEKVLGIEEEALKSELGSRSRLQGQRRIIGKRKRQLKLSSSSPLSQLLHPAEGTEMAQGHCGKRWSLQWSSSWSKAPANPDHLVCSREIHLLSPAASVPGAHSLLSSEGWGQRSWHWVVGRNISQRDARLRAPCTFRMKMHSGVNPATRNTDQSIEWVLRFAADSSVNPVLLFGNASDPFHMLIAWPDTQQACPCDAWTRDALHPVLTGVTDYCLESLLKPLLHSCPPWEYQTTLRLLHIHSPLRYVIHSHTYRSPLFCKQK